MADDSLALAAITARALADVLATAAARLPLTPTNGQAIRRAVYVVAALQAPAIRSAADVVAIGGTLARCAGTVRAASAPADVAPVLYDAAAASALAAPRFASAGRQRAGALGRILGACLEAAWLGEAFVAEAQSDFGDQGAANAARRRIAAAVDGALDRIAAAGAGQGVLDLFGSVARTATEHVATVSANLRPVVRVTTPRSAPSTRIAFELYGDPSRAPELVARNRVATPLFMPASLDALAPDP